MNQLNIIGGLTRDPESRTTQSGKQVCTFTVGVNRRNDREKSDFFRVSAWGELGNNCAKYLAKGRKVAVTGSVSVNTYQAQNGETRATMDVFAEKVEFLSPAGNAQQNAPQAQKTDAQSGFVQVVDVAAGTVKFLSTANTAEAPDAAQDFRGQPKKDNLPLPPGDGFVQVDEEQLPF